MVTTARITPPGTGLKPGAVNAVSAAPPTGEHICAWLADVTALVVALCPPGALYLSGGDVAIAVAHALGATGFQIRGRVAECVPYGHFLGGRWSRPVMTKAGGFGTDTTLLHVVNFIEEKLSV